MHVNSSFMLKTLRHVDRQTCSELNWSKEVKVDAIEIQEEPIVSLTTLGFFTIWKFLLGQFFTKLWDLASFVSVCDRQK